MTRYLSARLITTLVSTIVCLLVVGAVASPRVQATLALSLQETSPAPPADRTLIYFADGEKTLRPLALEIGMTPLRVNDIAKGDKRSYVELKGVNATTVIANEEPRFYLFLPDDASVKPPLIVRMSEKGGARRVDAMVQKGYRGIAVMSDEIIKPHYRVLAREGGMIFMEIRARDPLMLGEYAIIGADLQRISTFRIVATAHS